MRCKMQILVQILFCYGFYLCIVGAFVVRKRDKNDFWSNEHNVTSDSMSNKALRLRRIQLLRQLFSTVPAEDNCSVRNSTHYQFYCPSFERRIDGTVKHPCITDQQLCDHVPHCPQAEDEDSDFCMFYEALRYEMHKSMSFMVNLAAELGRVQIDLEKLWQKEQQ